MANRAVTKYLRAHAEPECAALVNFPPISPQQVLVIPAFRETTEFAQHIAARATSSLLVIVVINQPAGPEEPLNRELMRFFRREPVIWQNDNVSLFSANEGTLHWLVVDRFSAGRTIDIKQGVGLARKVGCDLAAALMTAGYGQTSWICSTDADATLPDDYFPALESCAADTVAAVFSVEHQAFTVEHQAFTVEHMAFTEEDSPIVAATKRYERALRYYVDGLAWAGSPYAFPTIGSALAVRLQAYCECRGFPRKPAGEDFYLLNKLAKLGRVHWLTDVVISVKARLSDRVPFGTGPAVQKILALADPAEFTYYAPDSFVELRTWLNYIPRIWPQIHKNRDPLEGLPDYLQQILREAGIETLWAHIQRQVSGPAQCETSVHHWFDAFQTLKFIRRLQDMRYPALPLEQCLQLAPFYSDNYPKNHPDNAYQENASCRTL